MDNKKRLAWNVFSGLVWLAAFLLVGLILGHSWKIISLWLTRGSLFIAIFVGSILILYIFKWLIVSKGKQILSFSISVWHSIKHATVSNPDVQKLVKKHPLFFTFIKARLDKSKFSGLPATLFLLVFIYTIALLVGIVEDIIMADPIVSADTLIAKLFAIFRSPEGIKIFLWITLLGKWQVVLSFAFAIVGVLWAWRKQSYIAPFLLAIMGSESVTTLGKIAFHRPRPELAIYTEHSFSFPSGHATIAVAFYGFLTYILIRSFGRWKTKINLFFAGVAVILLVGFSRLYLGVHYVSDVWGGYLVGALWLIISISISEWLHSIKKGHVQFSPQTKARIMAVIVVSASLLFYVVFAINYHPQISQSVILPKETLVQNINDIFSDEELKYTETLIGKKQEPLSFVILAESDDKFIKAFTRSGWFLADKVNIPSVAKIAKAALLKQAYPQAPMTPSFWNKQTHNFGFEKPTGSNNVRQRHHARFWKTNYITKEGRKIYVGAASLDTGIKWGITHKIDPDIDTEQEFIFNDMKNAKVLADSSKQKFVEPILGQNFSGDQFFTHGQLYVIMIN